MSFEVGHNMNFKLPTEWKWHELVELQGDEKRPIISGPFGSNIGSRYFKAEGVPVIRGNNLSLNVSDRFIDEGFVFLSEEKAKELNTWATKNDILFTAAGTIGQVGLIESNSKFPSYIISNKQIRVRLNTQIIFPQYAYYWLSQPLMIKYIQQRNTGSTIPLINLSVVKSLPIAVPPVNVQKKIISIISSLDDKIKLNRQINQTLEAIAQAIFKEWFVEFNFPGATGEMQDSELGKIPKGWRVGKLGDVLNIEMGQSPPGSSYNQNKEGIIFFQGKAEFGFRFPFIDKYTTEPKRFANQFDTLLSVRAPVGTINMASERCCIGRGLAALRGKSNETAFPFYLLKSLQSHFDVFEGSGTVFGSINKFQLENLKIIVPNKDLIKSYEQKVNGIDKMIFNIEQQSKTLTQLRDSLLPKLMKGELILNQ
jgi:type I restriction enzyme, S subunit